MDARAACRENPSTRKEYVMTKPNQIDEFFLKATALDGAKRRQFLRTLPANLRAQVEALLAADESASGQGFLAKPIHQQKTGKKEREVSKNPRNSTANASASSASRKPSSERPAKRGAQKKGQKERRPQVSRPAKRTKARKKRTKSWPVGTILAGLGGVTVCVVLIVLIAGTLRSRFDATAVESVAEVKTDTGSKTETTDTLVSAELSAETAQPSPETPVPAVRAEFYTAAVNAPPLTERQLQELPTALHKQSAVTTPISLPGVRSWTVETMGYRTWSTRIGLSVDGVYAAIGSVDGCIRIVNTITGGFEKLFVMPTGGAGIVEWSADGTHLFAHNGFHIFRMDSQTGHDAHRFTGVRGEWSFSSDRSRLYVVKDSKLIVISSSNFSDPTGIYVRL